MKFTVDGEDDHEDKKLPVLDLKMWMEDRVGAGGEEYQEVLHEFYEKEMVAPRLISEDSALPSKVKLTTLTQEIIRIRKNTSRAIREKVRVPQMSHFAMKMMLSGYDKKMRREILISDFKGSKTRRVGKEREKKSE